MLLTKISDYIKCKKIYQFNRNNLSFNYIATNSKNVKKLTIFAIIDNLNFNQEYINEAISKGAIAILTAKYIKDIKINQFVVDDVYLSLRILLEKLYPRKPINTIALTGTNGKTSVAWYISQFCILNKIPSKTFGTLGYYVNNKKKNNSYLTTPNFEILYQAAFSKLKNKYNFIFEASSHAIIQERIKDFPINIAAITNISQDHLDYHKTFKNYQKAKFNLFTKYLNKNGYSILNENISNINFLKKKINNKNIISYGHKNSDINLYVYKNNTIIKFFTKKYIIKSTIFNNIELENIACAIACCFCLNIGIKKIIKTIKKINNPPGRLEEIKNKKNYKIFVDYAHTPEALKQVLINKTNNNIKPNILFGCGGNRDKGKRFKMGHIANKYANRIFVTDDNPRNEDPAIIRKNILDNCKRGIEIADRKKAIFHAVNILEKNEILIIAGKGHEKYQINKKSIKKFDDVAIIKLALKKNEYE